MINMGAMPPNRRPGNRDLPPNLYASTDTRSGRIYYRYRDARNGKYHGMGYDKATAIADAKALNAAIAAQLAGSRLESIAHPVISGPTLGAVALKHMEICEDRHRRGKLAANTLRTKRSLGRLIEAGLGSKQPLAAISVRAMADLLADYTEQGKERMAQSLRSEAIEIWKTAIAEGWITDNVPARTRTVDVEVKRSRLTLEMWRALRQSVTGLEPWIGLSMDLAMLTAQRVEDIAEMEFKPRKGATAWVEDGSLWIVQNKTGNRVCIPLSLRMDALGMELGEVVARCRDRSLSRHLLHHTRPHGNAPVGAAVHKQTISKAFTRAVRKSGITWEEGKTAPTFHEQRSLAIRLYAEQGVDAQALAGHKEAATTAIYKDVRGSEWVKVKTA